MGIQALEHGIPLGGMFLACALAVADVAAGNVARIEITMRGPGAVRVRVAEGVTMPCDSADNRMLVQGKFKAGEIVRATTTDACVCVQQTYEPFADVDWSSSGRVCSPLVCTGRGRFKRCQPAPDSTIRIDIHSKRVAEAP